MIALVSLLVLAAPADLPGQVERGPAAARSISRVWLRGVGLDEDALARAVAARLTDKQVLGAGADAGPIAGAVAVCHVGGEGAALRLEVILGDGRVYQRTIAAPAEGRERTAARLIASTIAAIEDETATPDRRDGVFVAPAAEPVVPAPAVAPAAVGQGRDGPVEQTRDRPVDATRGRAVDVTRGRAVDVTREEAVDATRGGAVDATRDEAVDTTRDGAVDATRDEIADARPVVMPVRVRAPIELGLVLEGGLMVGLGLPAAGLGFTGGGGGLRVDLRLRRGATLAAGFRGLGRVRDELVLGRYRGALLAGYVVRRRALEVSALVGPTLETWQVREGGAPVTYAASGAGGASLLFGGLARLGLGGRLTPSRRLGLRVGGYVEVAGSARGSGRAAQIARRYGEPGPVFVLGGAELSLGLELELWFTLPDRRQARVARRSR